MSEAALLGWQLSLTAIDSARLRCGMCTGSTCGMCCVKPAGDGRHLADSAGPLAACMLTQAGPGTRWHTLGPFSPALRPCPLLRHNRGGAAEAAARRRQAGGAFAAQRLWQRLCGARALCRRAPVARLPARPALLKEEGAAGGDGLSGRGQAPGHWPEAAVDAQQAAAAEVQGRLRRTQLLLQQTAPREDKVRAGPVGPGRELSRNTSGCAGSGLCVV